MAREIIARSRQKPGSGKHRTVGSSMYSILFLGFVAFVSSFALTPLVRNLANRRGWVDEPDGRKIHHCPMPRLGGIPIALAYSLAFGALFLLGLDGGRIVWAARGEIWSLLPAAIMIFAVGIMDDVFRLNPWQKIAGQIAAALLACGAGVHMTKFAGMVIPEPWNLIATTAWLVLCTNALNLIDGIDGLAAGVGLFATVTTMLAALLDHNIELAIATAPLAGALLAFIRFNFSPATIFLGDSGSLFIGFLLGCFGIMWSQKSATILGMTAPLMALSLPLIDTGLAVARRFLRHQPIFGADRDHIHHRLLDRGFTQRKVVLILYGCCALGAAGSLAVMNRHISGLVIVLFCGAAWIGIQHLGYIEFGMARRMFMEGAFRRQLTTQIALRYAERDLAAATTPAEYFEVLKGAARKFGFYQVSLRVGPYSYEFRDDREPLRTWSLRVPLDGRGYVDLSREFNLRGHATAVALFVDVVHRTLTPKLHLFRPAFRAAQSSASPARV